MSTDLILTHEFSELLEMPLTRVSFITKNTYCSIYRGVHNSVPVIIKKYTTKTSEQAQNEARGFNTYHRLAAHTPEMIDARTLRLNRQNNILCVSFIPGKSLNSLIYSSLKRPSECDFICERIAALARFLHSTYIKTQQPKAKTDSFIFDHFRYCTHSLASLPLIGTRYFADAPRVANELCNRYPHADAPPSFCHGDLTGRNILVDTTRIGCIDFTNALARGHFLNDYYAFLRSIDSIYIPASLHLRLRDAFVSAASIPAFPEILHRFYYEYHRYKWLMLRFKSHSPLRWYTAVRSLKNSAPPFHLSPYPALLS